MYTLLLLQEQNKQTREDNRELLANYYNYFKKHYDYTSERKTATNTLILSKNTARYGIETSITKKDTVRVAITCKTIERERRVS